MVVGGLTEPLCHCPRTVLRNSRRSGVPLRAVLEHAAPRDTEPSPAALCLPPA